MKKILLTTIFCLCVAFVEGETFYIGRDIKVNMAQPSISIQNQIKKVFLADRIPQYLRETRRLLRDICRKKWKNTYFLKDTGDSILFERLRRIFPDIKGLYYCYHRSRDILSLFITSEDVEINPNTFMTETRIPYINFVIDINANANTYKLRGYFVAYGNCSTNDLLFYMNSLTTGRVILRGYDIFNIGDISKNMAPLNLNIHIQKQIEKVFFDDINIKGCLGYVRGLLIKRCKEKNTKKTVNTDPGNSILFYRLRKIFPDIKGLYYCYDSGDDTLSFFITSEDKDVKVSHNTFMTRTKIPYINFIIDTENKLIFYSAAYGNYGPSDTPVFLKDFFTK